MSLRVSELVFRHKVLLLLPLVFGGIFGFAWLISTLSPSYASRATIWVDKPTDFNGLDVTDSNPYNSPAQNQANSMRELLGTKTFLTAVASEIDPGYEHSDAYLTKIRSQTTISPFGTHVLYIESRTSTPADSATSVTAIVNQFQKYYSGQMQAKTAQASTFYETQLNSAKTAYDSASIDLQKYVALHPSLANVDIGNAPISALTDLDFARIVQTQLSAKDNYDKILNKYASSQIDASSLNGTSSAFGVIDKPEIPTAAVAARHRDMLAKPMTGAILGAGLAAIVFVILWRLDQKVRTPGDLSFLGEGVLITNLPAVTAKKRAGWPPSFVRLAAGIRCGIQDLSLSGKESA